MKKITSILILLIVGSINAQAPDATTIIKKVDENLTFDNSISESRMVIHGRRNSRTVSSKAYSRGAETGFTEYLSPAREKGTKMLKLEDRLWIFSPSTDRTIQLSGHMLRQSVMGSDLSYEDAMEDRKLQDIYNANLIGEETLNDRKVWVLDLKAKVDDATYDKQKLWVDQERFVPLKEEYFAKSGQLLKRVLLSEIEKIGQRWYPKKMNYKDMLKDGEGTDFIVDKIEFNVEIPDYIFSKASLKQ